MTDCIEWTGARNAQGYGRRGFRGTNWHAHRVAWTEQRGEIPEGMCVLHHCDNPPCVNVDHLFLGTKFDNNMDKITKGRANMPAGERHFKTTLTQEDVRAIRNSSATNAALVKQYGVVHQTISNIRLGRTWKAVAS